MRELVLIPTYKRPEFLHCCLERIRKIEPDIPIAIFPDRGTWKDPVYNRLATRFGNKIGKTRDVHIVHVPDHSYHGNSFNTMEAFRYASDGWEFTDRVFYIEDDVMVHPDFFDWHREQLSDDEIDIFASMAWVFNRYAPLEDVTLYQPWYYAIGTCFPMRIVQVIAEHASPLYYADMQGYVEGLFKGSKLNSPFGIQHFEQDGLIQRIVDALKMQTASSGIAKCTHIGTFGYNRGWEGREDFFNGCKSFEERVVRLEEFIADPYARVQVFDREIVEREIGRKLPKREIPYLLVLPGGWSTTFTSEVKLSRIPAKVNSAPIPVGAKLVEV